MQRERKREQQRERFYEREERKRAKRHKNSLPEPYHSGANAAADAVARERNEGMKTAAAVEQEDSSQPGSDDSVPRYVARWARPKKRTRNGLRICGCSSSGLRAPALGG
jgi:hypothetical protein